MWTGESTRHTRRPSARGKGSGGGRARRAVQKLVKMGRGVGLEKRDLSEPSTGVKREEIGEPVRDQGKGAREEETGSVL